MRGARLPAQDVTERVPQMPPRCRLTRRLREQAGTEIAGRGITPAEAARHAGISWPVAHAAFAAAADPVLEQAPAPVAHLGIDEHRRGNCHEASGAEHLCDEPLSVRVVGVHGTGPRCTSLHRFRAAAIFYPNFYPNRQQCGAG
jgi:hypothetical protein